MVYDGQDFNYVDTLLGIYDFEHIIMNSGRRKNRFALINRGVDAATGDYFMHLENDFYWDNPNCVDEALIAFEKVPELDYVRFEFIPFTKEDCQECIKLENDVLCLYKEDRPRFQFTFNPHLRKTKFPIGRFIEAPIPGKQPEGVFADMYRKTGRQAGCLMGENFRHIGVYAEQGYYKPYYTNRMTLRRDPISDELFKTFKPMEEFKKFCSNPNYIELFRRHLDAHKKSQS